MVIADSDSQIILSCRQEIPAADARSPADPQATTFAAAELAAGRLVAFPTETVYGLGADAGNALAVAAIYETKGRPRFNPLIVHVLDLAAAERLVDFDPLSRRLAEVFWPGPLTLVLPRREPSPVADLAAAGLSTLAIRVPSHPLARALLMAFGHPIVAPSANRSGHVSPTTAQHVADDFADLPLTILDGGAVDGGLESTIVRVTDGRVMLLRAGLVPRGDIEAVICMPVEIPTLADGERPDAPGMLASHYAPHAAVRVDASEPRPDEAFLAFGPMPAGPCKLSINLSQSGDLREAAANLFAALRRLDRSGAATIAVAPIPDSGLGEAINDRLRRAAAPRSDD